jgi:hypothetical protein
LELSFRESSDPHCPSRVSRDVQLCARVVFAHARERQILLGGARLSPQARRFDPLPVFGQRALAFSRLLLVQLIELMFQGPHGLSRLTIILFRLDHESRRRGRGRGDSGRENSGGKKQGDAAAPREASPSQAAPSQAYRTGAVPKSFNESIVGGGEANSL